MSSKHHYDTMHCSLLVTEKKPTIKVQLENIRKSLNVSTNIKDLQEIQ